MGSRSYIGDKRQQRAASPVIPLPDLQIGLQEYKERVRALAELCHNLDRRCLFLTQPSMYRGDLTPFENSLLWFGSVGPYHDPLGYVSSEEMERALTAYNSALLDTCQQIQLECYDLAPYIPKDTSAFYDEVHFNEEGAQMVAGLITDYLLSKPPFMAEKSTSER